MKTLSIENQIYLCKYCDIINAYDLKTTMGINIDEAKEIISKLKENGLYEQYRNLSEEEYECIIKKEKRKSKYEKVLDKYNFDKTKRAYNELKEVLRLSDNYKDADELKLGKIIREIAEKQNMKDYIINNDCKRILDNTYNQNKEIFETNKYYKKPSVKEFVLQELNIKYKENIDESKENICENKEISGETKENINCEFIYNTQIGDIENTFVKVSVKTIMEWSYQKRIFR